MTYLRYPFFQVLRTDEDRVIVEVSTEEAAKMLTADFERNFNRKYHYRKVEGESDASLH